MALQEKLSEGLSSIFRQIINEVGGKEQTFPRYSQTQKDHV